MGGVSGIALRLSHLVRRHDGLQEAIEEGVDSGVQPAEHCRSLSQPRLGEAEAAGAALGERG